ncbi:hypothetical protein BJV78DRAFT_1223596 [Lactifluus subvellereus]|nr:hypothetical protein BJV78DRAFT_1223596 [Lactifluus subvellereus]
MSRVKLADISALTLYNDEPTLSRRNQPIPQLICKGKACKAFTPDVIRCVNLGGEGTDVDWKCETDLPESLRLGRVQVSCEGWSGPGDPYVLKGSCSLEYRLQEVSNVFRSSASHISSAARWSTSEWVTLCLCIGFLAFVLYKLLRPCFGQFHRITPSRSPRPRPSSNFSWFPGGHDDDRRPPPPYSKYPHSTDNATGSAGTSQVRDGEGHLGFWSGAALGGLGTYLLTRQRNPEPQPRPYDWESERHFPRNSPGYQAQRASGTPSRNQPSSNLWDNRGEGSSSLGSMRRSTGYGGSTVR